MSGLDKLKDFLSPQLGNDILIDDDGDLALAPNGDISLTMNGQRTLLQDVDHCLKTMPGDIVGHENIGGGVPRLLGEENADALIIRAIKDCLLTSEMLAPRIKPNSIEVTQLTDEQGAYESRFDVSFVPIDEDDTNPLNYVYEVEK